MRYLVLACDYDGTLAHHGVVDRPTLAGLEKLLASGRSKYRILQPRYPAFPPFWTGAYWVRLRGHVKDMCEAGVAIASIFSP